MSKASRTRVLLVEDDQPLGEATLLLLKQYQYQVEWAKTGQKALNSITSDKYDVIILDLNLPEISGLSVLKTVRHQGIKTPIIILTALGSLHDRVQGLDAGADDYLIKPFDVDELIARIRALLRRSHPPENQALKHLNIVVDTEAHQVTKEQQLIDISRREFSLLVSLLENAGRVLSRDQLIQAMYGWGEDIDSNTLEVHIHNLRKKLGSTLIKTIRGVGYMIEK